MEIERKNCKKGKEERKQIIPAQIFTVDKKILKLKFTKEKQFQ